MRRTGFLCNHFRKLPTEIGELTPEQLTDLELQVVHFNRLDDGGYIDPDYQKFVDEVEAEQEGVLWPGTNVVPHDYVEPPLPAFVEELPPGELGMPEAWEEI